jgi:nitrite reductase (NADH) small subunit
MLVDRTRWRTVDDPRLSALAEGALLRITIAKQHILFARVNGKLCAMLDQCPHQGKSMADGWCEDGYVVCPWHQFAFDPVTGKSRKGMTSNASVFEVREENDGVRIGMPYVTLRIFGIDLW